MARRAKKTQTGGRTTKPGLTLKQMLARIPEKEFLTTPDVQYVFGDVHKVTIYKWVQRGRLHPYRVHARGKANLYKRDDVAALVRARFAPRPVQRATIREKSNAEKVEKQARARPRGANKKRAKRRMGKGGSG